MLCLDLRKLITLVIILPLFLIACAPQAISSPTPLPTQTLIPATATHTPTPITPTATLPDLIEPDELLTTPTATPPESLMGDTSDIPADLVDLAISRLSEDGNIAYETIRLVENESRLFFSVDNPCEIISSPAADDVLEGYRMVLLGGGLVYTYHVDEEGLVFQCSEGEAVSSDLLAEIDPVAGELVALARRRLADELDLSTRSIDLLDLRPITWSDTSLGCPQEDQDYADAEIDGYRIVLGVGERDYAYHTDSVRVISCESGQEQVPEE